jgi:16S rRNA (cytidine1402-2'-O)-methyltransferase
MNQGQLTLIPTPIDEVSKLSVEAFNLLQEVCLLEKSLIVVEDNKPARKRWIHFGLPREAIEKFLNLNEHNAKESTALLIDKLKAGFNIYLMSDGGLPAFCDPGSELVYQCHKNKIKVTSTPFSNSVILALALSGFYHLQFKFLGFLPLDQELRQKVLNQAINSNETVIMMDTPYRLKRLLEELDSLFKSKGIKREIFLALDLNSTTEDLHLGMPGDILLRLADLKREFILIIPGTKL